MITIENKKTDRVADFKFSEKYSQIDPYGYLEMFQEPDWYLKLGGILSEYFFTYKGEKKSKEWLKKREEIVKMVDELLRANLVALGNSGKDWDKERKDIECAIIHHTSTSPKASLGYLNALTLIRLYAKSYSSPESSEYGKAIWSNHVRDEKQTFIPYHYLIKRDGTFERALDDNWIGWHAGEWEMNTKSIGICFVDDLEDGKPSENAMKTAINIIKKYHISKDNVLGHREVKNSTTCPGKSFFNWKYELIAGIDDRPEKLS